LFSQAKVNVGDASSASTAAQIASKRSELESHPSSDFYLHPPKDWSAHKKDCQRPKASPIPVSPFGQMFNIFSGLSAPMSTTAQFFEPMFGYTKEKPTLVYADLVNAYRLLRLGAHGNASRVPSAAQSMEFSEWMEKATRTNLLPEWWDPEANGAGIDTYTREDAWGRLDRVISRDEISASLEKKARMLSLEMMVERIVNCPS
jgi:hypothetical protein